MGGGEIDEPGVDASRLEHRNVPFDDLFENNSTFVGEGSAYKSSLSQLPVMKAADDLSTAARYQGIQAVDSGGDKSCTDECNQGIGNLESCSMDLASDGFEVPYENSERQLPRRQGLKTKQKNLRDSQASSRLYSLMQIKLDKQDLNFVEKVTLLQSDIYSLCNRVVPNSVRHHGHDKNQMSFSQLNDSSLRIVGFYGNKNVMMDIFRTNHIVDASTVRLMEKGEFQPGLYCSLRDTTLHLFYWHQGHGHTMSVASRKDISCNFIRYLVELCHIVHICLDSPGLGSLLTTASKWTVEKKKRTQRLKISMVKASENDLKFLPGWEKQLPLQPKDSPARSGLTISPVQIKDVQLTEGHFRAAVLVATPRPPRMSIKTDSDDVKIQDVPKHVAIWQTKFNLDARGLDDKDFAVLLEHARLEGYQGLCALKDGWRVKQAAQTAMEYKIDELLAREQLRVLGIFKKGVSTYLKLHFPWEESLLSEGTAKTHSEADVLQLQVSGYPQVPSNTFQNQQSSIGNNLDPLPPSPVSCEDIMAVGEGDVYTLERDICEFWAGAQGDSENTPNGGELIFCGSEVSFVPLNDGHDNSKFKYTVRDISWQDSGNFKRYGPIVYGEDYYLKRMESGEESREAIVKFFAEDGVCSAGPVLTGHPFSLKKGSKTLGDFGGVKVLKRPSSDPVDKWMQSLLGDAVPSLQHKASLIKWGITRFRFIGDEQDIDINVYDQKVLINSMLSGNFEAFRRSSKLGLRFVDSLSREWETLYKDSPVQELSSLSPDVVAACTEIHTQNRSVFGRKVSDMVKRSIYPLLREKIKLDLKIQKKELAEQANMEESQYILSLREVFNTQERDLPKLSIRSCKYKSTFWQKEGALSITYSTQVQEKENLSWNAIELALLKKDLDALHTKENQVLIPKVHDQVHLMDLDSNESRLSKVVYLRSGSVLIFLEKYVGEPLLSIFLCPKLGADLRGANPKRVLRKPVDLVAFDEGTRFLALYVKSATSTIASIEVLFFDETYSHLEFTGIQTNLREYNTGCSNILWMRFVPGKAELVLIDSSNCARLLELTQTPMFRARHINIPFNFCKACVSADGSCLIVLHTQVPESELNDSDTEEGSAQDDTSLTDLEENMDPPRDDEQQQMLTFEVYWLETMTHLKSHAASEITISDVKTLESTVVTFGTQMHLLIHSRVNPSILCSIVLESSSASEVCEMQVQGSSKPAGPRIPMGNSYEKSSDQKSCPELDFVYHIFDKFSTSPPLITEPGHRSDQKERDVEFIILLKGLCGSQSDLGAKCEKYVKQGLEKLRAEKAKDFSGRAVTVRSQALKACLDTLISEEVQGKSVPMGIWIQRLMCLVPLQIARAENNGLKPLVDGLQIPSHLNYADALSLAGMIHFGFYESLLEGWVGDVKVISSMGKQSSGKSYLLNHLSGSLLDVSGGRCTDGVWMTVRPTQDCLYVLLDFEGLGSFERSEQEDMLLSIFNAAVSNITIFNKKDFHLDKETEAVFEKFQSGVSLVKKDSKLFQGLFYIAIKDVDASDVEDLKMEFQEKILQICSKSKQNFLTSMYGGEVEIAAMPPFQRLEYHDSIKDIASTVRGLVSSHQNGLSFMRDLKLVLAQISAKDWSPIDSKRVAFKICLLRKHWETAISSGRLVSDAAHDESSAGELVNFDTGDAISERMSTQVGHSTFNYQDTGILLKPPVNQAIEMVLDPLRTTFQNEYPRNGEHDEAWHSSFESFLAALAERRKERVLEWIRLNTLDFEKDGDVQKLRLEALATLASLQQRLTLCSCKCPRCSLRCIQERSHPGDHSCRTDHKCKQTCTYCFDDIPKSATGGSVSQCSDSAGHQGPHDCQEKAHTCGLDCSYLGRASNCNKVCTEKAKHTGDHKCNSRQHMCGSECSLPGCPNPCVIPFDLGDHNQHVCHEKMCPEKCTVQGCHRNCSSKDHFHSLISERHHFCGDEHPCHEKCDAQGICEVLTEVVKKTRTFQGIRATFDYEHVSEQNGMRKTCCIPIPPNEESHQGPHSHTLNQNAVHFCETRCHACGYFCNLPIGHTGFHNTNHGNMKDVHFVSETEEIDIMDRKYAWGESGQAEMCMMHCKNQGRGHVHLIPCLSNGGGVCAANFIEGARHETCKYGPDFDIPKDELTHAAFWKHMRFKDPCSEDDARLFALCNHRCRSTEHNLTTAATSSQQQTSYCVEPLWHKAVSKVGSIQASGFITDDGHRFSCDHSKDVENHVIFVIDRSGSMSSADCIPTMAKFTALHRNRLGCVYESILRFIRARQARIIQDYVSVVVFDTQAITAVDSVPIAETLVDYLLPFSAGGGTTYSCGIKAAEEILLRSARDPRTQKKTPVVIFLSDGENNGGEDPVHLVKRMKQVELKLILHTIKFGRDSYNRILMDMASAGSGSFQVSLDEVQLARSFEGLAHSLKDKVSSLM